EPVDISVIKTAVRIAQKTPSVCNRQSGRVHIYGSEADKTRVLSHQAGNRGFGNQAAYVLIVTADLRCFASPGERFQSWIDGGMFAMSLIYALHAQGLGSCALNWSATSDRDIRMRKDAGIPDNEVVMMMISVGRLPESFPVARSPRKPLEEVATIHSTDDRSQDQ
ncbi:MAG: nitroreductase family protein, partial [Planctomycetota bacterium]